MNLKEKRFKRASRNFKFVRQLNKIIKFLQPVYPEGAEKVAKVQAQARQTVSSLLAEGVR